MGCPLVVHGQSMDSHEHAWIARGQSIGPWVVHVLSMYCPWTVHGQSTDCHGLSMPWIARGLSM
eukprot:10041483-Lingulodinium_polyedra.AAC.1